MSLFKIFRGQKDDLKQVTLHDGYSYVAVTDDNAKAATFYTDAPDSNGTVKRYEIGVTEAERDAWNAKQDAITIDETPTKDSSNPVTSDGVKSYVDDSLQSIDGANVNVEILSEISILNTGSPTLGEIVYFRDYPDIKWCVDHIDGDYVYLGGYNINETTQFGSNNTYSGSTIAQKCTDYLNNVIPNIAQYLEDVTVEGVTNKVFIPTYYQFSGTAGYGDTSGPVFSYPSASRDNRLACYAALASNAMWLSTAVYSLVWFVTSHGDISTYSTSETCGFRPEVKVNYKQTIPGSTTIKDLNTALNDKQDRLTFDTTPTAGSTNPVTSDGVKSYVDDSVQDIDGANVTVTLQEEISILNTDSPVLGETVYFKAYPDIAWQVQHLDGDYAYLALYPMTERTTFGSDTTYSGSTVAQKCIDYLNNTIPNVADYLESVTVEGVTAKVFIPSNAMYETDWDWSKDSPDNRVCRYDGSNYGYYWTSTAFSSTNVRCVSSDGSFFNTLPSETYGFRPAVKANYKLTIPVTTTTELNTALDDINTSISEKASNPYQTRINFSTSWQGSDPYTQEVTVEKATENSRVDLHPMASTLVQLAEDGVSALYVENKNGTFTANAVGGPPSTNMRMLATVTEVTPYAHDYLVNPTIGQEITWCGDTWIIVHFNDTQVFICKKTAYGTGDTAFNSRGWSESNPYACRYQGSNLASVAASYASTLSSNYPTDFSHAENYTIHGVSAKIWAPAHGMVCNDSPQPYNDSDGTNNYENESARGCGTSYYPIFSLFNFGRTTHDSKRICYNDSGTAVGWWTASAARRNSVWYVTSTADAGYYSDAVSQLWFRPFACLTR